MIVSAMKSLLSKHAADMMLTDAEVDKVEAATGMLTLKHGELANIGMAAMTMAHKEKDAETVRQAHQGQKSECASRTLAA